MGILEWRRSRNLVVWAVFLGLFVDSLLLTLIVPIVPFFEYLQQQTVARGMLYASKGIVQLMVDPLVRGISSQTGRSIPIIVGNLVLIGSSLMFAFVKTFPLLVTARAIQGIGSSCLYVAGLGLITDTFEIDEERDQAVGKAMGGLALGIFLGPPVGGILFQLDDDTNTLPFIVVSAIAGFNMLLFLFLDPIIKETVPLFSPGSSDAFNEGEINPDDYMITHADQVAKDMQGERARGRLSSRVFRLLGDVQILIVFGAIMLASFSLSALEPTIPFYWVSRNPDVDPFVVGIVFASAAGSYAICTPIVAWLGTRVSRYILTAMGLLLIAAAMPLMTIPNFIGISAAPLALVGAGMALIDVSSLPMLALLVEKRHSGEYNLVFILSEMSTNIGRIAGALLSSWLTRTFLLLWTTVGIGALYFVYSPLLLFVRRSTQEEATEPFSRKPSQFAPRDASSAVTIAGPSLKVAAIFAETRNRSSSSVTRVSPEDTYDDDWEDIAYEHPSVFHSSQPPTHAPPTPIGSFIGRPDERSASTIETPSRTMTMIEYVMQSQVYRASASYKTSFRSRGPSVGTPPRHSVSDRVNASKKEPLLQNYN